MKNRKKLIVSAACAALMLVVVGLLFERNGDTASSTVDVASSPRQNGNQTLPPGRGQKTASTAAAAPVAAAPAAVAPAGAVPAKQTPTKRGTLPFVLKSTVAFEKPLRLAAEAMGAKTVASLSRKSLLIEATPEVRARLKADARFEDVTEFAPAAKIQPALAALVEKGAETVEVSIVSLDALDRETVIAALTENGGEMLKGCINEGDTVRAKIPSDCVATLAARGEVRWMEKFVRPKIMNDIAVTAPLMNVKEVWDTHGLTGAGQGISTSDSGIDTGDLATLHEDLRNRVKDIQIVSGCDKTDTNGHGTHTAGSIVGDGTKSDGQIRGTAYGADLYAWFCGGTGGSISTPDTMKKLYLNGGAWTASVHSASWGSNVSGEYTSQCVEHDRFAWTNPEFLPVFSAGNEGCDDDKNVIRMTIGSPGSAKNVLTVGATQSSRKGYDGGWGNGDPHAMACFSSRGPCQDGRTKPDVTAPGVGILSTRSHGVKYDYGVKDEFYAYDSGTSMSCPLTAGAVALIRQWLVEQKGFDGVTEVSPGVTNRLPTAALMKAVITGGGKEVSVPNNDRGWGGVDLENTLFPSDGRAVKLIDRIPFAAGFVTNIAIETTSAAPLDVQLVWIDYPGSSMGDQTEPRLVNDLDLTVESYGTDGGTLHYGNGGDGPDTLNNVESVRLASAPVAKYVITVDCRTILHDHTEGGAAALYIRGAFDPDAEAALPDCVHLVKADRNFFALDKALAAATNGDETVQVIRRTHLYKSVSVPTNCTIVTAPAEPGTPVVRCSSGAVLSVKDGLSLDVDGVSFTNVCSGFSAAGTLRVTGGTSFATLESVTAEEGGQVAFTNVTVLGDAPAVSVAADGLVSLCGFSVGGAAADWSAAGRLVLDRVRLAERQAAIVAASGQLTIGPGVTNLTKVTLANASKNALILADALVQSVEVSAPTACTDGATFGSYTCDDAVAQANAPLFVNMLDPEGEMGGRAYADKSFRWDVIEDVPPAAAGVRGQVTGGAWEYYYGFKRGLRAALAGDYSLTLVKDSVYTNEMALSHDLTLTSENGATLALGGPARFTVPTGTTLTLTNLTVCGIDDLEFTDCAFKVTGGALLLEDGATLTGLRDNVRSKTYGAFWGCTIVVTSGSVTMKSGVRIADCATHYQGGAIWVGGKNSTANLLGGTIENCSAREGSAGGGAVYSFMNAHVNVGGDFTATDNTMSADENPVPGNLFLSADSVFTLTNELTGAVGVSFGTKQDDPDLNALGANFIALGSGVTDIEAIASAARFSHDVDTTLVGRYDVDTSTIVWGEVDEDDGQCPEGYEDLAGVRVTVEGENGYRYYWCIDDAFEYVKTNATFEVKGIVMGTYLDGITKDVTIDHDVRITSWEGYSYNGSDIMILWRTYHAMYKVAKGGSLTLSNVKIVGACSYDSGYDPWDDDAEHAFTPLFYDEDEYGNPIAVEEPSKGLGLISVDGGSLTLEDGARVGFVFGNASRASNAITVFNGGTVTMESGSRVTEVHNEYRDDYETSCGGGILLDRSTGYFEGGLIYNCKAYRAGGLYVANESTASVSGDIYIGHNYAYKDDNEDNIVVSKNSNFVLTGLLSCMDPAGDDGYIGVNEGIAGDTSCFATVDWEWTDFEELEWSAEYFFHDRRGEGEVYGVPVTNWNAKTQRWDARLVWSDSLSQANGITIDGETYRGAIPAGLSVAVPKAFSVTPTTGANGKQVLSLEGGVEGCWYTVYSTEDLAQPFAKEASVQLKPSETFEYEVDQTRTSKFYKVVAEEGLK